MSAWNAYPLEAGAYADIILVDGNPLEDMSVLGAHPIIFGAPKREETIPTIRFIMKDGKVFRNSLK